MRTRVTKTVTGQNQFTDWCQLGGQFQLLISGLSSSTVTLQGSPDSGITVYDLATWNDATYDNTLHVSQVANSTWLYRVGVNTGDYGGGDTITLILEA